MVRLKDYFNQGDLVLVYGFQFQYGAIKGAALKLRNSVIILFQFQYGAIKGKLDFVTLDVNKKFQFQYGAIKGQFIYLRCKLIHVFQFQYGAIKGVSWHKRSSERIRISIPIWCD